MLVPMNKASPLRHILSQELFPLDHEGFIITVYSHHVLIIEKDCSPYTFVHS